MRGVSENVMLGQVAPFGTGNFTIFLDEEKLKQVIPNAINGSSHYHPYNAPGGMTPQSNFYNGFFFFFFFSSLFAQRKNQFIT